MYRLIRFGTVEIEYLNQVDTVGGGGTPYSYMPLPGGGALDGYASTRKLPGAVERTKMTRLFAANADDLEAIYLTLLGLQGTRDKLYRRTRSGEIHWQYARLVEVSAEQSYEQTKFRTIQDVGLRFVTQDYAWRGTFVTPGGLLFDSGLGHSLGASPDSHTVSCGTASDPGRAPVTALKIIIDSGNAVMSNVTIARTGGESLTYTGNIQTGGQLVIDCGLMTVSCTGVSNAYDNLTISPTADMAAWFSLQPGDNVITVTYTGGGTGKKISFEYYEAWR